MPGIGAHYLHGAEPPARRSPWIRCYDEHSGCHYMFNETTGESVWEETAPADAVDATADFLSKVEVRDACAH